MGPGRQHKTKHIVESLEASCKKAVQGKNGNMANEDDRKGN